MDRSATEPGGKVHMRHFRASSSGVFLIALMSGCGFDPGTASQMSGSGGPSSSGSGGSSSRGGVVGTGGTSLSGAGGTSLSGAGGSGGDVGIGGTGGMSC